MRGSRRNQFTMDDWKPDERRTINGRDALFWVVPAKVEGDWTVSYAGAGGGTLKLNLAQQFQEVTARATWGSAPAAVSDVVLSGGNFRFAVADPKGGVHRFAGTAGHDGKMTGTATDPGGRQQPFTATR